MGHHFFHKYSTVNATLKIFATGLGSGYFPIASGTAGTVVGCAILWLLSVICNETYFSLFLLPLTMVIFFIGVFAAGKLEKIWGDDPSQVVIDEIVGLWVTMLFVPFSLANLVAAFFLFRLFDIWKPCGIRRLECLKNGWGVMVDDVAAGILANLVLQILLHLLF